MSSVLALHFEQQDILPELALLTVAELDDLEFGVIGFDAGGVVQIYNRLESRLAGLSCERVIGSSLFVAVAPCMNNFMVAQRFEDAAEQRTPLDAVIDYVFTLRMRPVKVKLRLLSAPQSALRYVLVKRPRI